MNNSVFTLVGCKSDLKHLWAVNLNEVKKFVEDNKIPFQKCSALNGTGIYEAFEILLLKINLFIKEKKLNLDKIKWIFALKYYKNNITLY